MSKEQNKVQAEVAIAVWKIVRESRHRLPHTHDPTACPYCLDHADSVILAYNRGKKK